MILVVDDEVKIAKVICEYLNNAGYETTMLHSGEEVMAKVEELKPNIVLLDVMLPGIDGLSLCKDIKDKYDIPVILVTARGEEVDRIAGLELGADDYICKPFSTREVVARVKARLRNSVVHENTYAKGFRIDEDKKIAWLDDKRLDLTPVEYRLLLVLYKNSGFPVSRDILMNNLYEDNRIVSDRTVDSHVKNLRKKLLEIRTNEENLLLGVYGRGYQLGGE